ncbi:hypothetical protein PAMP_012324 [Pampus punctatissimus]
MEKYKMQKFLGQGRYGHVLQCLKLETKEIVAVKFLKQKRGNNREISILEKLRCFDPDKAHIVRFHESFQRKGQSVIVFEMLDMSLYDYMYKRIWAPMPLHGIRTVIKDIANALNVLKGIGLIHTDLKLDNIMLIDCKRQPFRVKLIDFGLALEKSKVRPGMSVQPIWYRSPEVILGNLFTEAIDIWSLGMVMAHLLLGFPLWKGRMEYDVLRFTIDLLGQIPVKLLDDGKYTGQFYYRRKTPLCLTHWTLKTPVEFFTETNLKPLETRKHRFANLDELKTFTLHKEKSSAQAVERSACVELLKEMFQLDPKKRITPCQILAHPFIRRGYLNPSNTSQTSNRDPMTQYTTICIQALQDKLANYQKAKDNVLTLESVSDDDTSCSDLESVVDYDDIITPVVPPNSPVETPASVLNQDSSQSSDVIEKKKRKKKKGIRGFFASVKRILLPCFSVHEDDDEE